MNSNMRTSSLLAKPPGSKPDGRSVIFVIADHYKSERLGIQVLSSIALEEGYARALLRLHSMPEEKAVEMVRPYRPSTDDVKFLSDDAKAPIDFVQQTIESLNKDAAT